ncbi:protein Jade-3 isoform X2 [Trifolium pratense]|uniref:protein Jade-3 isoform X2 n=1 Tax=Trifolium pratense TaxID=57577 RepID=UPI001E690684|nr:protein Jade-3 isoform X2 [Trifolium pratense]
MDFTTNLNDLPPNKRIRLIQQKQQQQQQHSPCSLLPTKKRKESRNTSLFHNPQSTPSPSIYSLPTKKRVCALQPHLYHHHHHNAPNDVVSKFDLNVEYNPALHSPTPTEKQPQKHDTDNNNNDDDNGQDVVADDDGILCCVCQSTDANAEDPIVFCDGCNLMVHASCYGNPLAKEIPEGDWFCERCRFIKNDTDLVHCSLCPNTEGAMKQTIDGKWAHLVCALLVPEVFFVDPEGRDGIDCSKVPKKRWLEKCYVCECCDGCALVCSEPKCGLGFHITCGIKEDLCIEYKEGKKGATVVAGFCKSHSQLWEKVSGKYKIVAVEDK